MHFNIHNGGTASIILFCVYDLHAHIYLFVCVFVYRVFCELWTLTVGGGFPGLCDRKGLYKHLLDFKRYGVNESLKLKIQCNNY
jgi:hypothetical protein